MSEEFPESLIQTEPVIEEPQSFDAPQHQTAYTIDLNHDEHAPAAPMAPQAFNQTEAHEIEARIAQMESEAAKLREYQAQSQGAAPPQAHPLAPTGAPFLTPEQKADIDSRSVHVGNVDYGTTPEELQNHFKGVGTINRVTILLDKFTGHPKGFAYIEFSDAELVPRAIEALNDSLFRERQLKVTIKRTNLPGLSARGRGRGRGGPMRGRGRGRGAFRGRGRGRGASFAPY
ncbi:hypothetical protein BABINDRAFT_166061 [Babjeviella inositovora NRRL Y-12698]|uniref:RRM domain-containing protein n=1 Tax=Babjeviella inositovora NRRL Y-12698 TaxID=984486 RepID=A0A1E3QUK0_9ASCO|nr:uncharacterized protein BABINDRAFT_166061 [Babjeviella inositovora NRRL Y-12698]ODQ81383.1 hypothetical protein BABINDRAFT_166061 [Babjeviella inositovora NRRL Y-12698]